ncbi:type II toxin-antitoxin system death-on-curing family toxin [Macrococcus equi]|uniref:type II toxin-antitoxin system death-on-curing family toxin n=1 Tax=Macrococcus equi TaxID=3395462 RepID=UPI0039BDAA60
MIEEIIYFEPRHAIEIHDSILKESGGLPGIKDKGTLESLLEHLKNDLYYPTFEIKVTRLVFAITKFHTFMDGNKRSAIGLGTFFLNINDYEYCTDTFIEEMENIVLWTASGLISEELLLEVVTSIINNDCLTDTVKLKLIEIENIHENMLN